MLTAKLPKSLHIGIASTKTLVAEVNVKPVQAGSGDEKQGIVGTV